MNLKVPEQTIGKKFPVPEQEIYLLNFVPEQTIIKNHRYLTLQGIIWLIFFLFLFSPRFLGLG